MQSVNGQPTLKVWYQPKLNWFRRHRRALEDVDRLAETGWNERRGRAGGGWQRSGMQLSWERQECVRKLQTFRGKERVWIGFVCKDDGGLGKDDGGGGGGK